jgi:hypothetical protein
LYSDEGGLMALERYGFLQLLRDKGFENLLISTDTSDASRHTLRIHFDQRDPEHLLIEMVLGFKPLQLPDGTRSRMLSVEWLLMQDPREDFPPGRAPLRDASSAIDMGKVLEVDGDTFQWEGRPQVLPITLSMQVYFERDDYRSTVDQVRGSTRFIVENGGV